MTTFDKEKLIEVVLYILNATEGLDRYHIFKVLYFAEREHLKNWGTRIVEDDFVALDRGPVPTLLYDAVKQNKRNSEQKEMSEMFSEAVESATDDASNIFIAKRTADMDYLSKADIECIDHSIAENAGLTFNQLYQKSHDSAYKSTIHCGVISPVNMAKAEGAEEGMLEYIKDQIRVQRALS